MGFSSHAVVQQVLATTLLLFITLASTKDIEIDNAGGGSTARKAGGAKKTGLFQRISRALDTGSAMDDDGTPFTDEMWEATRDEGEPVDPALMDFKNPVERTDAWKFDDGLKMLQTSIDGDLTNPVRDLVNGAKDLHAAWAVPHVFRALVTQVPLFQAFKPIQEIIKDKSRDEDYSPEDGVKAAGIFKSFMLRSMDVLDTLRDPEKFAAKLQGYAESKDKTLLDLFAKASRGEDENHKEINNFFMRQELGDGKPGGQRS